MKELRFLLKKTKLPANCLDFRAKNLALKLKTEKENELDAWNYYRLGSFSIENLKKIPRETISHLFLYSCTNVSSIGMTLDHLTRLKNDLELLGYQMNDNEWKMVILSFEKCKMLYNTNFIATVVKDWRLLEKDNFKPFLELVISKYLESNRKDLILDLTKKLLELNNDCQTKIISFLLNSKSTRKLSHLNYNFMELFYKANRDVDQKWIIRDSLHYACTLPTTEIDPNLIIYLSNQWLKLTNLDHLDSDSWLTTVSNFFSLAISLKLYHISNPIWEVLPAVKFKLLKITMKYIECCLAQSRDEQALDIYYQLLASLVITINGWYRAIPPRIHKKFMGLAQKYQRMDVVKRHHKVYKMLYPKSKY